MRLKRNENFFFQVSFFRCQASRRSEWNDIEVEVTAGDLCCTFLFDSVTSIEELKKGTARKLLLELHHHIAMIQDYIHANN